MTKTESQVSSTPPDYFVIGIGIGGSLLFLTFVSLIVGFWWVSKKKKAKSSVGGLLGQESADRIQVDANGRRVPVNE